jgi:hypothetical protein
MEKQQQAPVLQPFFTGSGKINPVWQRWFQKLKIRDDETRQKPYKIYTTDANLTTWDLGKTILFSIGGTDVVCVLPQPQTKDLWSWITIVRRGGGKLTITADSTSRIEYSSEGGSVYCEESRRRAANVTLQVVESGQWAITAGLGKWEVD